MKKKPEKEKVYRHSVAMYPHQFDQIARDAHYFFDDESFSKMLRKIIDFYYAGVYQDAPLQNVPKID